MNVKKTIEKIEGHSSNLLTFYLGIARKYSVLDPMIFNKDICESRGSDRAATGFSIVRNTIYYGVIQDIANIVFDNGKSNPSIVNIMDKLSHEAIINALRDKYASEYCPDPELIEIYRQREEINRANFDTYFDQLSKLADKVLRSGEFEAAKSVRDEFTAHLDIQYNDGSYEYPDIKQYGLKWNSPKMMLEQLKPLISCVGYVTRNADFAWESFETQNSRLATGFWDSPSANKPMQQDASEAGASA